MSRSQVREREKPCRPPTSLAAYASELRPVVTKLRELTEEATARTSDRVRAQGAPRVGSAPRRSRAAHVSHLIRSQSVGSKSIPDRALLLFFLLISDKKIIRPTGEEQKWLNRQRRSLSENLGR